MSILTRFIIVLGMFTVSSCRDGNSMVEVSYHFKLTAEQVVNFKSDLRRFALQNGYLFIDGSSRTKEAREYINRESERSSGESADLVGSGTEIIDVTIEPKESGQGFLIFAKTSAYNAEKVSLTLIYNENSAAERAMADGFSQSQFLANWKQ